MYKRLRIRIRVVHKCEACTCLCPLSLLGDSGLTGACEQRCGGFPRLCVDVQKNHSEIPSSQRGANLFHSAGCCKPIDPEGSSFYSQHSVRFNLLDQSLVNKNHLSICSEGEKRIWFTANWKTSYSSQGVSSFKSK